ncbi:hypothetical protein ACH4E7_05705 [Kitasatospora sp. NPDC018058]|uniref:hypothetical protein n=1 Tax=Kitasatospora sp. NPDC018058 TaxID=3364025 RepID=UPI0037C03456
MWERATEVQALLTVAGNRRAPSVADLAIPPRRPAAAGPGGVPGIPTGPPQIFEAHRVVR